jgi:hypothetical protein
MNTTHPHLAVPTDVYQACDRLERPAGATR